MNKYPIEVGAIVVSKMGRDEGRSFVVIQELDSDFVLLADGGLRTMDHLKKKRRKHLKTTQTLDQNLRDRIQRGVSPEDFEIRASLSKEEG